MLIFISFMTFGVSLLVGSVSFANRTIPTEQMFLCNEKSITTEGVLLQPGMLTELPICQYENEIYKIAWRWYMSSFDKISDKSI